MKNIILLSFLTFSILSCKKTWQCECKRVDNWDTANTITTNVAVEDEKKKDAEVICKSMTYDLGSGNYQGCSLKK